jgi:hypothetical protein
LSASNSRANSTRNSSAIALPSMILAATDTSPD